MFKLNDCLHTLIHVSLNYFLLFKKIFREWHEAWRRLQNSLYDNEVSNAEHITTVNCADTNRKLSLIDNTLILLLYILASMIYVNRAYLRPIHYHHSYISIIGKVSTKNKYNKRIFVMKYMCWVYQIISKNIST